MMDTTQAQEILGPQFALIFEDADRLIDHLALPKDARILDVGTGMGYSAISLAVRGYRVVTGEPASDDSEYARQDWRANARAVGVEDAITFRAFAAEAMPFDDASFDAILFCGVLHHVDASKRGSVVREAFRATASGGRIVFVEPNAACMVMVRERHPDHPEPAEPTHYADGLAVTVETLRGRYFDATIFRKNAR